MSNVWFTSDLHIGHRAVAELRGFGTVEEHDQTITGRWADVVDPGDTVWVLGDLALSKPMHALDRIAALPGTKHLVAGNHDPIHPMHRDAQKWFPRYGAVFASVQPFARRRINGATVLLSHFPYTADHTDPPRHMQWRLPDHGEWLIHGHTHSAEKASGREVHVGVDGWNMTPVSLDTVADIIQGSA